ncbi:hypothetical protein ckrop_0158 [Corynebacterium kroppenstedtii DSM 44385]|uniref:Uncharacterized protein n=1 Tax=Corynebacterium kroppenstedtii (strain DSM 44385 / JCM 11950 / CIP 105744 / CCUG 35717) TaxID=645127 RepID=C4LGA1_CORK4|nr:hypothetical protein ckrop_0158 [Corynebacterium kroppenstedtii DSM 44385]
MLCFVVLTARIVPRTFGIIGRKLGVLGIIVWLFSDSSLMAIPRSVE